MASACHAQADSVPTPTKVVIVIDENHSFSQIIGPVGSAQDLAAPTINSLARNGALMTNSYGVTHPSQPNYLAFFSGSTQGVTNDSVHPRFTGANLGTELMATGHSFVGYSQGLPSNGSDVASSGAYMRKHNPMTQFTNLALGGDNSAVNRIFNSANFPTVIGTDYSFLPAVSLVVPDQNNDMHDGSITTGDAWLKNNLGAYQQWAQMHNSLLILTWDEDNGSSGNRIATIFSGPMVRAGNYSETINHYNVLRTIEDMFGTTHVGAAATAKSITDIWIVPEPNSLLLGTIGAVTMLIWGATIRVRDLRAITHRLKLQFG
jgi:acid phosphatase